MLGDDFQNALTAEPSGLELFKQPLLIIGSHRKTEPEETTLSVDFATLNTSRMLAIPNFR
jgi:hypothetical protein